MTGGQGAVLVSVLLPALNRAREQANRVKSAANLREIGQAAVIFANDQKDGAFPGSFAEMYKKQELTPDVFINPRTEHQVPPGLDRDQIGAWLDDNCDYVWLGKGRKNNLPADIVLAYEKPEGLSDGINLLFADGHVEFMVLNDAQQAIDASKKGLKP